MPRVSTRSYLTYRHALIYVLTELQNEATGRRQAFHLNSIYAKARQLGDRGEIHLGAYATRELFKAASTLIDEDIIYKTERNFIGLASLGKKALVLSRERVGPLESLSPFKKAQFLKGIVGGLNLHRQRCEMSGSRTVPRQKYRKLENIIDTLRKSLRHVGKENRRIVSALEQAERERDDFQLEMLDAHLEARELQKASGASCDLDAGNEDLNMEIHEEIIEPSSPSSVDLPDLPFSSPHTPQRSTPSLQPIQRTGSFRRQPSGSFLNIVSNHFTPSPSSSPVLHSFQLAPDIDGDDDVFGAGAQGFSDDYMDMTSATSNTEARLMQTRQELEAVTDEVNVAKSTLEQRDQELLHSRQEHFDKDKKLERMQRELAQLSEKCKILEADLNFKTVEWAEAIDEMDQAQETNRWSMHIAQYQLNATATALAALQTNFAALQNDFIELQRNLHDTVQKLEHTLKAKHRIELEAVGREEELQTRLRKAERQLELYKQQVQTMWASHKAAVLKSMQDAELSFTEMMSSSVPRRRDSSSRDSGFSYMDVEANDFDAPSSDL